VRPFYVYILQCRDGSYYVGHTDNLEKRMMQHDEGLCGGYTSRRRPVELVFVDEFPTRQETIERERQLKGWSRAKKEALIRGDWETLRGLAKNSKSSTTLGEEDSNSTK
jgi:predicted GIY-YIG superfamily endonuclease